MISFTEKENPNGIFNYFLEISHIPHGSGNTSAIADYLVGFAKDRGLECERDGANNVIIRKPATAGYESRPTVIIQGHTDMVAEKLPELELDMEREGLEVYRDADWLRARGTTLGGDDGVAVAYALALLAATDIPHPAIEAVFTSDEEIGLLGAAALDCSRLKGRILINVDSDEEGIFTVGCAGGGRVDISLPISGAFSAKQGYKLTVSGLLGGHSGVEIDKNRSNAIKVGTDVLAKIGGVCLCTMSGGNMDNAIPRDFVATFATDSDISASFEAAKNAEISKAITGDPDIRITCEPCELDAPVYSAEVSATVLSLFGSVRTGVIAMSTEIKGLVESSENIGIARLGDGLCKLTVSVRSAKKDAKARLIADLKDIAAAHGASVSVRGEYPAWEYKNDSHIRDVAVKVYKDMYGKAPIVVTIHAGLECGLFSDAIPGLDCISIGPDNRDIHTTEEHLSISSTVRVWEFILNVLKEI